MVTVNITWGNLSGKPTIYSALRDKLGREPTHAEMNDDVKRILREAHDERLVSQAGAGKLPWQKKPR